MRLVVGFLTTSRAVRLCCGVRLWLWWWSLWRWLVLGVRQLPPCSCECVRVCVALFFCFARVCLLAPTWFCGQLSSRCGLLTALARLAAFVRVRLNFCGTGPLCGPKALSYRLIQVVCLSRACRLFAPKGAPCAPLNCLPGSVLAFPPIVSLTLLGLSWHRLYMFKGLIGA